MAVKKNISDLPVLRHYDKILVVLALIVLLVSLAYLITAGMAREKDESKYVQLINNLKPTSPPVDAIGMAAYDAAAKTLESPFVVPSIDGRQSNFLTPERRVTCLSCQKPILDEVGIFCPFCGEKQERTGPGPVVATVGEVPDSVKRGLGLPVNDVSVEYQDADGDGFTLREEYHWETDPTDPKDHPPYVMKLQLKEFRGKKLPLRFTAVNKMPDGSQLVLNWTGTNPRTYWVKENQPIEGTGYTAGKLTVRFEERVNPLTDAKMQVDVSMVVIKRDSDGKEIEVQINENEKNTDVEAILTFLVDDSELTLLEKQEFKLRDETYRVVSVNEKGAVVVVENTETDAKESVTAEVKTFKKES